MATRSRIQIGAAWLWLALGATALPACPEPAPDPLFEVLFAGLAALDPSLANSTPGGWLADQGAPPELRFSGLRDRLLAGMQANPLAARPPPGGDPRRSLRSQVLLGLSVAAARGDGDAALARLAGEPAAWGVYDSLALDRFPAPAWPGGAADPPQRGWLLDPGWWVVAGPSGAVHVRTDRAGWRPIPTGSGQVPVAAGALEGGSPGLWLLRGRDGKARDFELQVLTCLPAGLRELGRASLDFVPGRVLLSAEPGLRSRPMDDPRAWVRAPGPAMLVTVQGEDQRRRFQARAGMLHPVDP